MARNQNDQKDWFFVTGTRGFIGQAIKRQLSEHYHVLSLERFGEPNNPKWSYQSALGACQIDRPKALIHLAGAPTDGKRWTRDYQRQLLESRTNGTQNLLDDIRRSGQWPSLLISASAIGFYGHRPSQTLTESDNSGECFVSELAEQWERPIQQAMAQQSITETRFAMLRFGMVLGRDGGALKKMLLPFKLGLGATIGHGRQYHSWISIDDVAGVVNHLLDNPTLSGIFNAVSPNAVTNREFTKELAKQLKRPTFLNIPQFMVKLLYGLMGTELLLADLNIKPRHLIDSGYEFKHPTLAQCLNDILS